MSIKFFSRQADGSASLSKVKPFTFPGGEHHLRLPDQPEAPAFARVTGCDVNDLAVLGLWADWAHQTGFPAVAHLPYLPAARADRGAPFGAQVYANLVNALSLDEVIVFDPHSPVAPELINNVRVVESTEVICERVIPSGYEAILAPDAGAVHRAQQVSDAAGLPLFTASKTRDFATGKLTGFEAPVGLPASGRILIVDDICDGGGTFMGLASALQVPASRLDLWVSHGIFSGRAPALREYFGNIWTTDSHDGAFNSEVGANVVELTPYL
ncbi:ribose-phosphate pyrophosphokinase [Leucobacter luti]|uniref:Ribose-phosphate pyrophosphokinase n=1 Tax=Leucobacter luti TaxID=340320 RepID=A0A4R6RZL5_9MICO|nr:phosphoribosyltransferase family protein [Leucobacter luti]TDP92403.1 ribose-phosphate pyrophosphokinase [Leucobacter luti]